MDNIEIEKGMALKLGELADQIPLDKLAPADKDMLWCVTRIRTGAYVIFSQLGLMSPQGEVPSFAVIEPNLSAVLGNYAIVAAQHPVRIEYAPDKIETPRLDILGATAAVYAQLTSDDKVHDSALELVRLVATNPDSSRDAIGYATLVGILLRIVNWLYPHVDLEEFIVKNVFGDVPTDKPVEPAEPEAAAVDVDKPQN